MKGSHNWRDRINLFIQFLNGTNLYLRHFPKQTFWSDNNIEPSPGRSHRSDRWRGSLPSGNSEPMSGCWWKNHVQFIWDRMKLRLADNNDCVQVLLENLCSNWEILIKPVTFKDSPFSFGLYLIEWMRQSAIS